MVFTNLERKRLARRNAWCILKAVTYEEAKSALRALEGRAVVIEQRPLDNFIARVGGNPLAEPPVEGGSSALHQWRRPESNRHPRS